jgi:DNA-directed RNA polymerase sigma subunit (sigma70/sigma32)
VLCLLVSVRAGRLLPVRFIWWIRQAIDRAVCNQAEPIRIPVHVHERRRKTALRRLRELSSLVELQQAA